MPGRGGQHLHLHAAPPRDNPNPSPPRVPQAQTLVKNAPQVDDGLSRCLPGALTVAGMDKPMRVVRNSGGGTSSCCSIHPVAAPAFVDADGSGVTLKLLPRRPGHDGRNGARAYLASTCGNQATDQCPSWCADWACDGSEWCTDGLQAPAGCAACRGSYDGVQYSALHLLGKSISMSVDLSGAQCGCNVAAYVVPMAANSRPGLCDGDHCTPVSATCQNICGTQRTLLTTPCMWHTGHRVNAP